MLNDGNGFTLASVDYLAAHAPPDAYAHLMAKRITGLQLFDSGRICVEVATDADLEIQIDGWRFVRANKWDDKPGGNVTFEKAV